MQLHTPFRHPTTTVRRLLSLARLMPALVLFGAVAVVGTSHTATVSASDPSAVVALFQVQDKSYDGTTGATLVPGHCLLVFKDTLAPVGDAGCDDSHATATFLSKNAGVRAAAASGITLTGPNTTYNLAMTVAGGRISPVPLDISATTDTRTYNGGTASSAAPTTSALQTGDSVTGLEGGRGRRGG